MKRKPVIITSVIVVAAMIFVFVFMSTDSEDLSNMLEAFRNNTPTSTGEMQVTVTHREIEQNNNGTNLGNMGNSPSDPKLPGLSGNIEIPEDLEELIMMPLEEVWPIICGRTDWPFEDSKNFSASQAKLEDMKQNRSVTFSVPIWTWASSDDNDMSKVSSQMNITCNAAIQKLVESCFQEIYNAPDQQVFTPGTCGGYSIRAISGGNSTSGHAYGCALDLNWTAQINGKVNIAVSGVHSTPTPEEWADLPECHLKYEIFYEGCTTVNVFKAHGFQWGGNDWTSYSDGMHFSFIGDQGSKCRIVGQENYKKYAR